MARSAGAGVPHHIYAVVPVRAAQHHEVRALHQEAGLSAALWRLQSGVVHLSAGGGDHRAASQPDVALQAAAGHHQFGGLFGVLRNDRPAMAEPVRAVSAAGWHQLFG